MGMDSKMILRIRVELLKRKWTQRDLAAKSKVSLSSINKLLKQKNKSPDTSTLQKLGDTLGISVGELAESLK